MNESSNPDIGFGASGHDPFQAAKASAMKAAEELRVAAAQKAADLRDTAEARTNQFKHAAEEKAADLKANLADKADELRHYADDALGQARQTLGDAREKCEHFVSDAENLAREKPRQALLTAFGIGVIVGLILRR
jgi:ElaB/YqjD/DUF883 family membrane-anchored ribosome-binding protein